MKEYFLRSSNLVNQYIWLVGLIGILNVSILSGPMAYVSFIGLIVGFFLIIVINGQISQKIEKKEQQSALLIIKNNWKNYLIAFLVLGIPVFVFNYLVKLLPLSVEQYVLLKEAVKAVIWVLSIYVMPIVFLRKLGLVSVIVGITYFFKNIKQSLLIVPFVVVMFFINAGGYLWVIGKMQEGAEMLNTIPVMLALNVASSYLSFIVFAAASIVLVDSHLNGTRVVE